MLCSRFAVIGLLSIFVLTGLGCGGASKMRTESAGGTVTYKGAPVAGATVTFSPKTTESGSGAMGLTDEKGSYKLQTLLGEADAGTTPGDYTVTITKSELKPTGAKYRDSEGKEHEETKPVPLLPKQYGSNQTTPLSATVVKGKNTFDFDLVD
ncbi:MAG: carboxypeptidase-like regulatory domain-containing protein [Thermoguttaceae bacterium]